jgi:hypothetical protein
VVYVIGQILHGEIRARPLVGGGTGPLVRLCCRNDYHVLPASALLDVLSPGKVPVLVLPEAFHFLIGGETMGTFGESAGCGLKLTLDNAALGDPLGGEGK